jgi:hypothetical protein
MLEVIPEQLLELIPSSKHIAVSLNQLKDNQDTIAVESNCLEIK